jgi:tripartite-type tricarboxylate transporter receptor subunit TctC
MLIRRRTLLAASAATATAMAGPALAQNYPRRAVQLIVAFPAGGSTDVGARILAAAAEKDFGQPITVVNKAGAGGQIGFTEAARARPDGYTLCFLNLPGINTITLDPERKAAFTIDSFIPVVNQVLDPGLIWVKGDSPYKTLADLIDAAKKNPGKISACTTGILSDDHLAILMMQEAAKVEFRIVHFDGGAQQITGVLGGPRRCRLRQCRRRLQARPVGRVPRAWPSPTTSAPSSCPR